MSSNTYIGAVFCHQYQCGVMQSTTFSFNPGLILLQQWSKKSSSVTEHRVRPSASHKTKYKVNKISTQRNKNHFSDGSAQRIYKQAVHRPNRKVPASIKQRKSVCHDCICIWAKRNPCGTVKKKELALHCYMHMNKFMKNYEMRDSNRRFTS